MECVVVVSRQDTAACGFDSDGDSNNTNSNDDDNKVQMKMLLILKENSCRVFRGGQ